LAEQGDGGQNYKNILLLVRALNLPFGPIKPLLGCGLTKHL
jgi:hypothetical protein